jgi:hypothetical protein
MRSRCLAIVGVGAMLLLCGSATGQSPPTIPTRVLFGLSGGTATPDEFVISASGPLMSRAGKCEAGRTVKLFLTSNGSRKLVDIDTSSRNGQWGVAGRVPFQPDAMIVRVIRKHVTVHHHRRVCGADQVSRSLVS